MSADLVTTLFTNVDKDHFLVGFLALLLLGTDHDFGLQILLLCEEAFPLGVSLLPLQNLVVMGGRIVLE